MGFGTQKVRFGADSTRAFGFCGLCLQAAVKPVTSQYGIIYCRPCILASLLDQKQAIRRAQESEMRKEVEAEHAKLVEEAVERQREDEVLERVTRGLPALDAAGAGAGAGAPGPTVTARIADWSAESATATTELALEAAQVPMVSVDPVRRKVLKLKNLFDIELVPAPGDDYGKYICASCKTDIAYKQCFAMRKCGHVACETCMKRLVLPDERCSVCSQSCKAKDLVQLEVGGSGFSAHNTVISTKYTPGKT